MRALVLAPHADDEALGAGGSILVMKASGAEVRVAVFYDRVVDHKRDPHYLKLQQEEAEAAQRILGYDQLRFFHLDEERGGGGVLEAILPLEILAAEYKPQIVIGPFAHDLNQEHRRVAEAMRVVFRPFRDPNIELIMSYEIAGSTHLSMSEQFVPSFYVDVSGHEEAKLQACQAYASEVRTGYHPRSRESLMGLMSLRGSEAGMRSAEAMVGLFGRAL